MSTRMDIRVGFYGKLPSRGDFVRGFLPRAVAAPWDQWLQSVLPAAQARLGEGWVEAWRAARAWRFAFAPGLCGPQPVPGVWLPSVDRVGRSFPLMIAVRAPAMGDAFLAAAECAGADAILTCPPYSPPLGARVWPMTGRTGGSRSGSRTSRSSAS